MDKSKFFINAQTGEVVNTLPALPCVEDVELKNYNKLEYHRKRIKDLRNRLLLQNRFGGTGYFVTLTYDELHLPEENEEVLHRNIILFLKRLRQLQVSKFKNENKIHYFIVTERGEESGRLHHHLLLWNIDYGLVSLLNQLYVGTDNNNVWNNGIVQVKTLNRGRIFYCLKYVFKQQGDMMFKYYMSQSIGFFKKKVLTHIRKFGMMFRSGKFFYRFPRFFVLKALGLLHYKLKEIVRDKCPYNIRNKYDEYILLCSDYHRFIDKFRKPLDLSPCIALNDNVYRYIPKFMYDRFQNQIECNRYGKFS